MNREEFETHEREVKARALRLWTDAGRPECGPDRYISQARELVAIEQVEPPTLDPHEGVGPVVEEASLQRNLGEFPTLRDQGDEMTFPDPEADADTDGGDDTRLSDQDASDTGGVLPRDDREQEAGPDVARSDRRGL